MNLCLNTLICTTIDIPSIQKAFKIIRYILTLHYYMIRLLIHLYSTYSYIFEKLNSCNYLIPSMYKQ